jgi:predicted PurR-regulated permease PerM
VGVGSEASGESEPEPEQDQGHPPASGSGSGSKTPAAPAVPATPPPAASDLVPITPDPYGDRHTHGTWIRAPFITGFLLAAGALLAYWMGGLILQASSVLILIVVSLFIAFGLNPVVVWLMERGVRRSYSVLIVALGFVAALALFIIAIAPVVADQIRALTDNAPQWFELLQNNKQIQAWDQQYDIISKAQDYVTSGDLTKQLFGGVLGVGLAILAALGNAFVVIVLTLYFLATLDGVKHGLYRLAPASRRPRVESLGDRILEGIGGYVSGAFVVALCAGTSTLIFLLLVGLSEYAVALAVVVAVLDVIPMIGATLGAVVVSAIALATDVKTGIICIIFFIVYQQVENYLIYPRVMSKSVDIPGALTVIAALIGASLLGVVGALLAIPTAAAILLLVREVFIRKQDAR